MNRARLALIAIGLATAFAPLVTPDPAGAQEVTVPGDDELVVIRAGRLIDGRDGTMQENVTILVRGNRIAATQGEGL